MNDKKYNPLEYMTGFIMGVFAGIPFEYVLYYLYTLLAQWQGWEQWEPAWWMAIPIPLISGLMMAGGIAGLHLEDY